MKRCLMVIAAALLLASPSSGQVFSSQKNPKYVKKDDSAQAKYPVLTIQRGFIGALEASQKQREEAESRGGQGPSPIGIPLADYVDIAHLENYEGLEIADLCRLSTTVYRDVNEASGIFYYYPDRWYLDFDPDEGGYHLRIDYKASSAGSNNVLLTAQLTPGFDRQDVSFLTAMLEEYLRLEGDRSVRPKLLPLPVTPEAEFHLASWDIEEVTINAVEPDTDTIHLSVSADVPTKELVMSTLIHEGLPGSVSLRPDDWGGYQTLTSPVGGYAEIRLGDIAGGPALRWPRNTSGAHAELENTWPFDMRLDYLVYLMEKSGGGLDLRGWNLGGEILAPGDTARVPISDLNLEFRSDNAVDARFVGRLIRDEAAGRAVIESHTGGVGALPVEDLTIQVAEADALFDQYSIYTIAVEIRSAHFDPEGREVVSHTYLLDGSENAVSADPLYLWEDPAGGDLYQYRIGVVTTDGVVHSDRGWRRPEPTFPYHIFVGSGPVEEVLAE